MTIQLKQQNIIKFVETQVTSNIGTDTLTSSVDVEWPTITLKMEFILQSGLSIIKRQGWGMEFLKATTWKIDKCKKTITYKTDKL